MSLAFNKVRGGGNMIELSGFKVTQEQMNRWLHTFLPQQEPYYIDSDGELLEQFSNLGLTVYSRLQFSEIAGQFIGEYGASYHHWRVPVGASILYIESAALKDKALRARLFAHQAILGRGQIYPFDWVQDVSFEWFERLKESHEASDNRIILTYDAWIQLPENIKSKWLLKWLYERVEPKTAIDVDYSYIPTYCSQAIKAHISTFPMTSGANCFSAAAGSSLGSSDMIVNWLNVEQFFDALNQAGLNKRGEITQLPDTKSIRPHDVLVWENGNGGAIHAAYAITDNLLFNKMGQFWFQPWQCVCVRDVWDYAGCLSNGGRISVYRGED